ncbi:hypothetical protein J7L05_07055, partial [bacterium]|nr:hypothetical protein [bacterium]
QPCTDIDWGETDTLVSSEDGFWLEFYEIPEFASYQTFQATVISVIQDCGPITGHVVDPPQPVEDLYDGQTIDFIVTADSANGGNPIVQYEMDYDFDGTTFNVDSSSTDGVFTGEGPFYNPNCDTTKEPFTFTVAFRATDSCDPPNTTVFATHQITIAFCCGPITGEIISPAESVIEVGDGQIVNFQVHADTSANGQPIVLYQVDWDYDGVIFQYDAHSGDGVFNHVGPFYNPNCEGSLEPYTYTVAFRATDNCIPPNLTVFATCEVKTYCGAYGWARSVIGNSLFGFNLNVDGTMTDEDGNIYLWGIFRGTYDFDPDSGVVERTSTGDYYDGYICKYFPTGKLQWVYAIPNGDDHFYIRAVVIDSSGNLFISGRFSGSMDFNPYPEVDQYSSAKKAAFLTKFNANYDYAWTRVWSNENDTFPPSIRFDSSDNIYLMGGYSGTMDFDPGPGVEERTSMGNSRYVNKLNNDGVFQRVIDFPRGEGKHLYIWDSIFNSSNDLVLTGEFEGEPNPYDFDPGPGVFELYSDNSDCFILMLDDNLNFLRAVGWGNSLPNDNCYGISVMDNDNIIVCAYERETIDLDPGPGVDEHYLDCPGAGFAYISCFNSNLEYLFGRSWGETGGCWPYEVVVDAANSIYAIGGMGDSVDFDPGPAIYEKTGDMFLSKFNQTGDFIWADTWEGFINAAWPEPLAVDNVGNLVITGTFRGAVDFNPGPDEDIHDTGDPSYEAVFLTKLLPNGLWE